MNFLIDWLVGLMVALIDKLYNKEYKGYLAEEFERVSRTSQICTSMINDGICTNPRIFRASNGIGEISSLKPINIQIIYQIMDVDYWGKREACLPFIEVLILLCQGKSVSVHPEDIPQSPMRRYLETVGATIFFPLLSNKKELIFIAVSDKGFNTEQLTLLDKYLSRIIQINERKYYRHLYKTSKSIRFLDAETK